MKHIFIINPVAGGARGVEEALRNALCNTQYDWELYTTTAPMDAVRYIKERCQSDEPMRFYACGGDGTLQEVAVGTYGCPNASFSCYPSGSGNDFVKYYGKVDYFRRLPALLESKDVPVDLIQVGERFSLNVLNFGFEAAVADTMGKLRHKPLIGGKNAYTVGILKSLINSMRTPVRVICDGELFYEGDCLLCTVANGQYVGGSFRCAPRSRNDDGLMDICLVKPISRLRFVSLIGKYVRGEHLDDPKLKPIMLYRRCKSIQVEGLDERFAYTLDGEVMHERSFYAQMVQHAVKFGVPAIEHQEKQTGSKKQPVRPAAVTAETAHR